MRMLVLILVLVLAGAAPADLYTWQVKCGVGDNVPPYGNDFSTRFGVDPLGTWDYDSRDAVHPGPGDPAHDLAFIYHELYYTIFVDMGYGWPPPSKPFIWWEPDYPGLGLIKDTREPIDQSLCPDYWLVMLYAPNEGATMSFFWFVNQEEGFEVPLDLIEIRIWGNEDLEAAGVVGDLVLNDYGPGEFKIEGIPQWGTDERGNPIPHFWVIQAALVPEPALAWLAGLAVSLAGLARLRRR